MTTISQSKSSLNVRTALLFALGISLLMNILFVIMFFFGRPPVREIAPIEHVFRLNHTMMRFVSNLFLAFLLYVLNFRLVRSGILQKRLGKLGFVLIIIGSTMIFSLICSIAQKPFEPFIPTLSNMIFGGMMRDFTISAVVTLSSLLMYISEKQQKTDVENERLQSEYIKTRFMALRNQVDPHFLFNSLNTLSSLIKTDSLKADEYVRELSFVFRYTLQNKEVISLCEELEFTRAYAGLMQIRYGDNLRFIYETDSKYANCQVIPMSLQTLVENAIKHNVVSNRRPLTVTFVTTEKASIKVSNNIQPKKEPEISENIGLSNLAERYRLMWNREIAIRNVGNTFEVEIPLISKHNTDTPE
ncbi:MAG: histidine kinase [Tannerella sp.]|jgi:sensor histidine kinase YesM|nr:histidine kinase [Tannerella sp.]